MQYIARWDGSVWSPLGSGVDNFVHALSVDREGNLYASGDFTTAGEVPALRIARWDSAAWSPLGSGIGGAGDSISSAIMRVDEQGNLYVGGQFTLAGNQPSAYLAKWCAVLESGGCSFYFGASASTPEPTPVIATPIPTMAVPTTAIPTTVVLNTPVPAAPVSTQPGSLPSETPTVSAAEPGQVSSLTPTDVPTGVTQRAGMDVRIWIGAGILLVVLVGGALFFLSRRR